MKIFSLLFILVSQSTFAYELFPELGGIRSEDLSITPNTEFSTEYGGDLLSFDLEAERFLRNRFETKYFDTTVGSLSGNEFHTQKTIKANEEIAENHHIGFILNEQKNYHQERDFQMLSWEKQHNQKWSYGILGEFFREKSNDDIGVFVKYKTEKWENSFYHLWPNYSLNKRNSSDDRYKNGLFPVLLSYRLASRDTENYWEAVFRVETKSRWSFPSKTTDYEHSRGLIQLIHYKKDSSNYRYILRAQYKKELVRSLSLSGAESDRLNKEFSRISLKHKNPWFKLGDHSNYIGWDFHKLHFASNSQKASLVYFSPWIEWKNDGSKWKHKLILTSHNTFHDLGFLSMKSSYAKHARYDAHYHIPLKKNFDWIFGLSIDVDRLGSDDTWEGGFSKLHWKF